MTEQPTGEEITLAPERELAAPRTDISVPEMRAWLRNWVAEATGQAADAVDESVPMVELGLSSRDAVAMATDIEDLTGVTLTATVAFRHPTIESLATVIVEGEPELDHAALDAEDWTRERDVADIAIVGLATRFPGDMNTPAEMWQALLDGRDAITDLPDGRWAEFTEEPRLAERIAKALAMMDPRTAHPYAITGTASSIIANRVSYFFDFRGPSVAVDTACSSSLVAVHQGVQALRAGEADVVVAGGVNALVTPAVTLGFDEVGGVLAPDGRIKSFSSDADGYARSEGGGMLVLKRLADARRDGDEIIAVIAGTAVNHDGRSNGLLAPNPDAQADVLRRAYKDAGINPRTVDYIEAHGTGTILGDPIEADALGRVVGRGRAADEPALLGAVKSNLGHLESAAGAASLAKVALSLAHDKIPPSINYAGPNPYIDFDSVGLRVADSVIDWPRYSGHAIAGVSGFGFGGANAHLVLREVLAEDLIEPEPEPECEPEPDTGEANAVYVGGVRLDEYGEFIDDDAGAQTGFDGDGFAATPSPDGAPELP
ncbi:MAG: polyketide synthase, partial [Mycobacteriaceae bacterium]|nr:polyketide synthase [Mycobacteriaceae bacterium]